MKNPFTPHQIRRYLLLYAAVVVFMALFYFVNIMLNPVKQHEKKTFETTATVKEKKQALPEEKSEKERPAIRLMDEAY